MGKNMVNTASVPTDLLKTLCPKKWSQNSWPHLPVLYVKISPNVIKIGINRTMNLIDVTYPVAFLTSIWDNLAIQTWYSNIFVLGSHAMATWKMKDSC